MSDNKVSILIVDDRSDKLLALEPVLEDLGQNIVRAYSGRETLRHVLDQEFAVILLDINMPGMDGFETATMIRQRKSSQHTPIIFITSFGDEMNAARGYSLGAVDFILTPVVPEVLRTKVSVFVELFKKTEQLTRQAQWLRDRAAQLHKLTSASLAINSALSIEQMLQVVVAKSREVIGAHQASLVATLDPGHKKPLRTASFSEKYPEASECCGSLLSTELHQKIRESNRPMRMPQDELQRQPGWIEPAMRDPRHPNTLGWLAAPLTGRDGRNLGLIELSERFDGDFNNDDEAILVQLAQMASIAIENCIYSEEREANRIKDEFLATLSHELRTPLNAMLGWTQLLRMENPPEEVAHGLEVIERNARSQTKLIEDLLDVSRITTGKLRLSVRPTELGPVVQAAADAVRPLVEGKGIQVDCVLDAADLVVMADPDRLQQVFWNLFSNAAKFTPANGRITVRLVRINDTVQLTVSDSGAGIDAKFLPFVFDRFRQADSTSTRSHGGLGIGLTIVRYIVELHGGTVHADSPGAGQGSTFSVTLPLSHVRAVAPDQELPAPVLQTTVLQTASSPLSVRVVIVDDDPDAREVLGHILIRSGATVFSAESPTQALELLQHHPDLVISDIAMPGEDGYSLLRRLRALPPEHGGTTPVIALTAYTRPEDRQRMAAAGFQSHLSKPVEPAALLAAVAGFANAASKDQSLQPVG